MLNSLWSLKQIKRAIIDKYLFQNKHPVESHNILLVCRLNFNHMLLES